jgi:hypothetical protein
MPKNAPITAMRIDSRSHITGNRRVYPSNAKGIPMNETDQFFIGQLSEWPWLHLAEDTEADL